MCVSALSVALGAVRLAFMPYSNSHDLMVDGSVDGSVQGAHDGPVLRASTVLSFLCDVLPRPTVLVINSIA